MIDNKSYPIRLPVEWYTKEPIGKHPDISGITGKRVVIVIDKKFSLLEKILARLFNAPRTLERPLDDMNSLFWELMDGTRTFGEICDIMDNIFHERIAPVSERLNIALTNFIDLNLAVIINKKAVIPL
ncbi:MAG: hypothetical protein OR994_04470 [Candidatus Poseidoniales archaeon]|jgi:hypothetical protein|nr:hypothetical protein [Candidatus Poseidoniales archaeon]|tara:strand:- start:152 stop:535 length:384 start_codon:yes stop_codon:yes gene_type:complete